MIDLIQLQMNTDLTSLYLNLAGLGVMITVFILLYTRPPRYIGPIAEEMKSWVKEDLMGEVKSWVKDDLMPTGLAVVLGDPSVTDEEGKPMPGMLDLAVKRLVSGFIETTKMSAMGEESGFSRRVAKTRSELVGALIPEKWRAALSLAGLDTGWLEEHSEELIQLAPELAGLAGGIGGLGGQGGQAPTGGAPALPPSSGSSIPTMKSHA